MPARASLWAHLAAVAGLCLCMVCGTPEYGLSGTASGAVPGLNFQEDSVLFTGVYPGERVEYVFRFRNDGDSTIHIVDVKPT